MKERLLKLAPILIPLAVISVVCLVAIFERVSPGMGMLDRWEHDTYDWRSRKALTDDAPAATNLATVFIDNYSLDQINEAFGEKWPWPTVIHANIVRELSNQDAEAVAFDVLFAEEDMNPDYEELPSDVFFGLQLSNANNVVLATFGDTKTSGAWEAELPNDRLRTNAFNVGHATADFDKDGWLDVFAVDMTYNLGAGGISGFHNFISAMKASDWTKAQAEGRNSLWCRQVGSRCSRNMGYIAKC